MSGTTAGGRKTQATIRKKLGGKGYIEYLRERGRKGGQVLGVKKGFALRTPEERKEFGRIGGKMNRKQK